MNLFAGLYKKEEQALVAYQALLATGFQEQDLTMLMRKHVIPPEFPKRASFGQVALSATIGAIILGFLGLLFALLIGVGFIKLPELLPSFEPGNSRMILNLAVMMFIVSALIGALIGAAIRLILSADQAAITDKGVKRGGLLLVVNIDPTQQSTTKKVLIENGAVDVENLSEMWDPEVWSRYRGVEIT